MSTHFILSAFKYEVLLLYILPFGIWQWYKNILSIGSMRRAAPRSIHVWYYVNYANTFYFVSLEEHFVPLTTLFCLLTMLFPTLLPISFSMPRAASCPIYVRYICTTSECTKVHAHIHRPFIMQDFLKFRNKPICPINLWLHFWTSQCECRILCAAQCKNKHFPFFVLYGHHTYHVPGTRYRYVSGIYTG